VFLQKHYDFEIIPEVAAGFRQNGEVANHNGFLLGLAGPEP
jgi:hypothetical protein